jgi:hypothetical protein
MTIPKRGSRRIEVDGEAFLWRVRKRPTADQRSGRTPLLIAIASEQGGPALIVRCLFSHPSNEVALHAEAVTPAQVAAYVREGKRAGWAPTKPGRAFELEPRVRHEGPRAWPRGLRPPSFAELVAFANARPAKERDVFRLAPDAAYVSWPGGGGYQPCQIEINGVDLIELVRRAERPHVEREIAEEIARGEVPEEGVDLRAGRYLGVPLAGVRWPSRELFDEPFDTAARSFVLAADDPRRGKTTVLGCTCGVTECWFLLVSVTVLEEVVIWADFEQFHRAWVYDLGPFVFDKPAYLRALGADESAIAAL